ncbi:hypothetical protein Vau01_121340 [Virgisporangium aurantiacum]|uniref:CBM-cenC domain-containing protein n=1 Tax=Virgisporangium aurantiacum TaxID=175570 RepID=A0A8J4E7W1_9ACTN|nr:hypothetical protein Vau01_121340 [Virgisporangium aurantiacum]
MGLHTVTITGIGTTATRSVTFTLAIHSPSCTNPGNQFLNSGFESGEANWAPSPGVIAQRTDARTGTSNVLFANHRADYEMISQTVTVPTGCPFVTLSFWLRVETTEWQPTEENDLLRLDAQTDGREYQLAYWTSDKPTNGYQQVTIDASRLAGRTVRVLLSSWQDASLPTRFSVDDFELNAY